MVDEIDLTPDTHNCTDTYQENNKTLDNNGSHTDELTYFKRTDKRQPKMSGKIPDMNE